MWKNKEAAHPILDCFVFLPFQEETLGGKKLVFSTKWNLKLGDLNYALKCFSYNIDSWNMCVQGDIWRGVKSSGLFCPLKIKGKLNYVVRITQPHSASGTNSHSIFYPLEQKEQNFDPGLHHTRHSQAWSGWIWTIFLLWQFTVIILIILRNTVVLFPWMYGWFTPSKWLKRSGFLVFVRNII